MTMKKKKHGKTPRPGALWKALPRYEIRMPLADREKIHAAWVHTDAKSANEWAHGLLIREAERLLGDNR